MPFNAGVTCALRLPAQAPSAGGELAVAIKVAASGQTHFVLDVMGYFESTD